MSDIEDEIMRKVTETKKDISLELYQAIRRIQDAVMSIIKYGDRIGGVDEYKIQNSQEIVENIIKYEELK